MRHACGGLGRGDLWATLASDRDDELLEIGERFTIASQGEIACGSDQRQFLRIANQYVKRLGI
jgi:hypothetical protein